MSALEQQYDKRQKGGCDKNIRWEMTPTSIGGEKQASISGGANPPSDIASGRITEVRS